MLIYFLIAFTCSVVFSLVLSYFLKRKAPGPYAGRLYFFWIIFLFTMGLGFLLTPIGPMYKNVPWLSIIAIGLLVMLLIAELLPHHEKGTIMKIKEKQHPAEKHTYEEILEKEFSILMIIIGAILIGGLIYALLSHSDKFKAAF